MRSPLLYIGYLLTFFVFVIFLLFICLNEPSGVRFFKEARLNEIGDFFAGFAGSLAFIWIIITVLLQREELIEQRKELSESNEHREHQNFEQTFFQSIRLLNEVVSNMDIQNLETNNKIVTGRDCFKFMNSRLRRKIRNAGNSPDILSESYLEFYKRYRNDLGHYFRILYNIIKFVDNSEVKNKRFYTNIVRAQLSDEEVVTLFYNCLSSKGKEKFKPLVEKYSLLKMIDDELIVDPEHKNQYSQSAFI